VWHTLATFVLETTVDAFQPRVFRVKLAAFLDEPWQGITVALHSGSVIVDASINARDPEAASALCDTLKHAGTEALTHSLGVGVAAVTANIATMAPAPPPALPPLPSPISPLTLRPSSSSSSLHLTRHGLNDSLVIGIALVSVLAAGCLLYAGWMMMRARKMRRERLLDGMNYMNAIADNRDRADTAREPRISIRPPRERGLSTVSGGDGRSRADTKGFGLRRSGEFLFSGLAGRSKVNPQTGRERRETEPGLDVGQAYTVQELVVKGSPGAVMASVI